MNIPKVIWVGGTRIRVQVKEMDGLYGQFLYDKMRIELNEELLADPREMRDTLRHEMVEAALLISGVGWSERYEQESVVRALDNIFWPAWEIVQAILDAKSPQKRTKSIVRSKK